MTGMRSLVIVAAILCCQPVDGLKHTLNPIRRVVNLLQQMQNKVTAEGKREEELFDRYMCYCKTGSGELQETISAAENKIPQVESSIKETEAEVEQLTADVERAKSDKEQAKEAIATATSLREKEAAAFAKEKSDFDANIAALTSAIAAIEKGASGGFLQTSAGLRLRQLSISMDLSSVDRDSIAAFLTGESAEGYIPQSGQIIGILKEMKDTMTKDLASATAEEKAAVESFNGLVESKAKQINALTNEIETKLARSAEASVEVVNMKEDLDDTSASLLEDKKFLADLEKNCATKEDEWKERSTTRTQELLAIADTIKLLNDDDALELFKKTLPSPSLLQTRASNKALQARALKALQRRHAGKDHRLDLISLALNGRKVNFSKVVSMIDDMVALLKKEQEDDDLKKATCAADLDKGEDTYKELEIKISDLEKASADAKDKIATLADEIAALEDGIKALDKQVAEATETRKEEHDDFVEALAADNAAIQLLGVAKNRLYKFYDPKLFKPAPKVELSAEESIYASFGGEVTTAAPGGIAGSGVTVLAQKDAPAPPPETWGAYAKKGEESNGVIAMVDMLIADLEKEVTEMNVQEKDSQSEYENFMKDSADKRASDSKSIADDEAAKAGLESTVQSLAEESTSKTNEAMATAEYIKDLHADCDWLMQNYEARKEARAGEVDSLTNAKAVLSGADYSLVQIRRA